MWDTTSWSNIIKAQQQNKSALQKLCQDYWPSVYAFLRFKNYNEEDAKDYTQAFFATFLEKEWIKRANMHKGKFRTFLLTLLTRFIRDQYSLKQTSFEESQITISKISHELTATSDNNQETLFNRVWAQSLVEIVIDRFRHDSLVSDKLLEYEIIWLYFFYGSPLLRIGDIKNPKLLVEQLCHPQNTLQNHIVSHFTKDFYHQLNHHKGEISRDLQKEIIYMLNHITINSSLYDGKLIAKNLHLAKLQPGDIKDLKLFVDPFILRQEFLGGSIYNLLPQTTQKMLEKVNKTEVPYLKIKKVLLTNFNEILEIEDFYKDISLNSQQQKLISELKQRFGSFPHIYINRLLLEELCPKIFAPLKIRLNRWSLEQSYSQSIISNIYVENVNYSILADRFSTYKNKIHSTMNSAMIRFRNILQQEIERYTDQVTLQDEIQDLLAAFSDMR